LKDPWVVAKYYIMGQFFSDVVSALPWSVLAPKYIFFRYMKLQKFAVY
jgi:hypothetical protein